MDYIICSNFVARSKVIITHISCRFYKIQPDDYNALLTDFHIYVKSLMTSTYTSENGSLF